MRDDFSQATKDHLGKQVSYLCSNPGCRRPTTGPQDDPNKSTNVGVAAHITAAAVGGPRYDPNLNAEERCSAENGIWLCQVCAKMIDDDEVRYRKDRLQNWKRATIQAARESLEQRGAKPEEAATAPDFSGLEFNETIGVYFDPITKLHICPRCKANGKWCHLKNGEHAFSCPACTAHYPDPARKYTSVHMSYRPASPWS